ncbi:MAG TPA: acyl-CoA dehydrogenase family protein [Pseudonocardiaceae bacterium]
MDLTLTEDQQLVQTTAREFLTGRASADLWKEIVELGWTGLTVPEEHGGIGSDFLDACLVAEELGRAGMATPFAATVAGAVTIARSGTEEQKQRWLPAIVEGAAIALPSAGAELRSNGDLVSGRAPFVPFAAEATGFLLDAGLVERDAPGITSERLDVVGNEPVYAVTFDAVPAQPLPEGQAARAYATVITCAEMVGGAQAVLDLTVDYAGQRRQFGQPIGSFQAVQHHCAVMAIDVLGARFATYEAAWHLGTGSDAAIAVSTAKAIVSDAYQRVCALGHQVHGAIGFTAEHDLHRYLRHATTAALSYGDAEFHLDQLATRLGL